MDQALLDRILRSPRLPTLPAIAVRMLHLTQHPDVRIRDLADTIEHDQAIAAKVLRTVNSSFYGLRQRCSTIDQALVLLGLSTVKTLALSFSLVSSLKPDAEHGFDHIAYWRRSLYSAVASRVIAREMEVSAGDEAFLGGLLQDIGVLALHQTLGRRYAAVWAAAEHHRELARYELAELEIHHAAVGAMLAQRWRLPNELIMPIKYHERPTAAPEEYRSVVRAVGLGNLACDVLTDAEPGPALRRFRASASRWFGLSPTQSNVLLRKITSESSELSPLFRLDGVQLDADEILRRAQEQLAAMGQPADAADCEDASLSRLVSDSHEYDPLTGALTRRAMLARAMEAFDDKGPRIGSLAVLAIEIDGFGSFSQREQDKADVVLVETVLVLQQHLDPLHAACARWDGGLFTALLPGLEEQEAAKLADHIRTALLRQADSWFDDRSQSLSWSAGVAAVNFAPSSPLPRGLELFAAALRALDSAKKAGGGCTHVCPRKVAA